MKHFTLDELKDAVQLLPFFGETLFEIHKKENGETIICILDEEQERFIDVVGDIVEGEHRKIGKMATLYMNAAGVVSFIEHPYTSMTKGNVQQVQLLVSLVGSVISMK